MMEEDDIILNGQKEILEASTIKMNSINDRIDTRTVTLTKLSTATSGYVATYELKQGGTSLGKIDIPKDFLVKSATLATCLTTGTPSGMTKGDKYIDFVINVKEGSATKEHVYVKVTDLVDVYTADNSTLQLSNNQFSIKNNGITVGKFADSVYETSYSGTKGSKLVPTNDSRLTNARTPTSHTDSNGAYGKATTSVWGHTKLNSATNSTDETTAATPKAIKTTYDIAKPLQDRYNGITISGTSKTVTKPFLRLFQITQSEDYNSSHLIFEVYGRNNDGRYAKIRVDLRQNISGQASSFRVTPIETTFDLSAFYFAFKDNYPNSRLDIFIKLNTDLMVKIYDDHTRQGLCQQFTPVINGTESYTTIEDAGTAIFNGEYTTIQIGTAYSDAVLPLPKTSITAQKFIKSGGTSSQFLKADGSVDGTAYAPKSHTDSSGAYGKATTSVWGHTKLNSATNSTDETTAATPKAVKAAYDLANGKPSLGTTSTTAAKGDHVHNTATSSSNGFMSSTDKGRLDGIEDNANKYVHPTSYGAKTGKPTANQTPAFGGTATVSQITSDASGHVTGATDRTIKIPNTLGNGTTAGLSTNDYTNTEKTKLNGIEENANNYVHPSPGAKTGKPTGAQSPAFGGTATVSQITSDASGHVTGMTDRTIKIPNTLGNGTTAGLSTNDYTNDEKNKLSGIATNANKYVHPNSGVTAGTNYNSNQTPSFNETFYIPKLTFDSQGHITASANSTVKIPALPTTMTPSSHSHGSLANGGTLNSDITSVNKITVTDSSNNLKTISKLPADKVTHQDISGKSDVGHTHTVGDVFSTDGQADLTAMLSYKAQRNHAVDNSNYGLATTGVYGHAKIVQNLTTNDGDGLVLGAGQGKALKTEVDKKWTTAPGSINSGNGFNYNDQKTPGSYIVWGDQQKNCTNAPNADGTADQQGGLLVIYAIPNGYVQILIQYWLNDAKIYYRIFHNSGGWRTWQRIYTNVNIPSASTSQAGISQLSSSTNSTSESLAATPKAVKAAYDLANSQFEVSTWNPDNSKFKFYKVGNVVTMYLDDWQPNMTPNNTTQYTNIQIPEAYRPPMSVYAIDVRGKGFFKILTDGKVYMNLDGSADVIKLTKTYVVNG